MKRWEKSQFRVGDEGDDTPSPFSSSFVLDPVRGREGTIISVLLLYYCIILLYYCIVILFVLLLYYSINSNLKVIWRIGFIFSLFFFENAQRSHEWRRLFHGMVTKECSPIDGFCFLIF